MMTTTNERFQVMNVEYENTGGGCMVLVATVYDSLVNNVRYVLCNEETINFTTVDYVFSEVEYEDRMLIAYYNMEEHEAYVSCSGKAESTELNELFEYCWLEFIKRDCKRYKTTVCRNTNDIPLELKKLMPVGYEEWLNENGLLVETDGEKIIVDSGFKTKSPEQRDLESLQDYLVNWMTGNEYNDEKWNEFYNQQILLGFGNRMVVIENTAAAYNSLIMCIREILSEDYDVE